MVTSVIPKEVATEESPVSIELCNLEIGTLTLTKSNNY